MLFDAKDSVYYASIGLTIWFKKMIPTLFPFMIISSVLIRTGYSIKLAKLFYPIIGKIFSLQYNCVYIIIMGFLCGFPMGASVIADSISLGKITKKEGAFLLSFTNNIGPIYFISFVCILCPIKYPYLAFAIMYGVPLLYGIAMRYTYYHDIPKKHIEIERQKSNTFPLLKTLDESINKGIESITKLGGYMVLFNLLNIIPHFPYFYLNTNMQKMLSCMLEISGGIMQIANEKVMYQFIYILLPFGGLSCIAQTYSIIKNTELKISEYILHKVIQTTITGIIYFFVCVFSFF